MKDLLVLFPGALGDFVCFWPTLEGLRRAAASGRVRLVAKPELFALLRGGPYETFAIDRREMSDLYGSAPLAGTTRDAFHGFDLVHSWTGAGDAAFRARLAAASGGDVRVHAFRGMRAGEHAARYYARCAGVEPVPVTYSAPPDARDWTEDFWRRYGLGEAVLVVHAGSGSPRKNWCGMGAAARWWRARGGQVVNVRGPAEMERPTAIASDAEVCGEPLDRVAALLARGRAYLGNDSGISHLAGVAGARGCVVFGETSPAQWRPWSDRLTLLTAVATCSTCAADALCTHRLPVDQACRALAAHAA